MNMMHSTGQSCDFQRRVPTPTAAEPPCQNWTPYDTLQLNQKHELTTFNNTPQTQFQSWFLPFKERSLRAPLDEDLTTAPSPSRQEPEEPTQAPSLRAIFRGRGGCSADRRRVTHFESLRAFFQVVPKGSLDSTRSQSLGFR